MVTLTILKESYKAFKNEWYPKINMTLSCYSSSVESRTLKCTALFWGYINMRYCYLSSSDLVSMLCRKLLLCPAFALSPYDNKIHSHDRLFYWGLIITIGKTIFHISTNLPLCDFYILIPLLPSRPTWNQSMFYFSVRHQQNKGCWQNLTHHLYL